MANSMIQLPTICHKSQKYCSIETLFPISQLEIFDLMECIFIKCLITYSVSLKNCFKTRKLESRI